MSPKRSKVSETPTKPRRAPRVPLWLEEGQRLAAILAERNIGQTELAQRIGRKFHNVHRWCKGYEFDPENQALAAAELDLPADAFEAPNALRKRDRETKAILAQFEREKPIARSLSADEWQVLRSVRFADASLRPSVAFFEAIAYALKGAIRIDEVMAVAEENAALDEALAHKPPLRRR